MNKFYNPKLYKPPPESFDANSKKSEESNGIIARMDALIKDLDKEMTEAEVEEKDAQADCEHMMKDSADKRAEDFKACSVVAEAWLQAISCISRISQSVVSSALL